MKRAAALLPILLLSLPAAGDEPPTLLTLRGRLLAAEDFAAPPPPFTGQPSGFASGFLGWRYHSGPGAGKSGNWELRDGVFTGIETPGAQHPATASYGIRFQDAVIQCEVRLDDVPAEGRLYRSLFLKATDSRDYVCALNVGPGGLNALAYDETRTDPKTRQRAKLPPVAQPAPVKPGGWHSVVLEILGDEIVATLDGRSVTLRNPLLAAAKHSVMLGAGTQAGFRHFRIWEARPNPAWPANREKLGAAPKAAPAAR